MFQEKNLTPQQVQEINHRIENLPCLPFDLDSSVWASHTHRYFLMFKRNETPYVTIWQGFGITSRDSMGNEYVNPYKRVAQDFSCYIIKLADIKTSEKGIVLNDYKLNQDSLEYDVFVTKGYVMQNFTVEYRGHLFDPHKDGVFTLRIHKSDTNDLRDKIMIRELQWDDSMSVY